MRTATVRELRHDFGRVMASVEQGEAVEISKRGKIIALLSPPSPTAATRSKKRPDFLERFRQRYGSLRLPGNIVVEERDSRSY
jgi:prevent-host-death family protein